MQQFLVPQFIDVENKILGPITVRQFVIMIVIMGLLFIFYKTLDFAAFILVSLLILALGAAFGFLKVNGAPFHIFLLNVVQTSLRPSLRVWNKNVKNENLQTEKNKEEDILNDVKLVSPTAKLISTTRLSELSLIVNTGGYYKGEYY
jgi:hypothetical protein